MKRTLQQLAEMYKSDVETRIKILTEDITSAAPYCDDDLTNQIAHWRATLTTINESLSMDDCPPDDGHNGIDQDEVSIPIGSGFLVFAKAPTPVDYIRLVQRKEWLEIAFWTFQEWEEEPKDVMGAILGGLSEFYFGQENSLDKSGPRGILKLDRTGKSGKISDTGV